ncbi:AAA family ATPase [Paenibacillus sp. ATY16]|uniref:McrB family protein n=1 Tax=Paenibacillus sp. ATY16 TaxID=1759312 RepID=UPI00200DE82C|nr:AAA family ATPase [Paenibacillus sp. ATY16]MCK9858306.1 AAA family ATPase [Paenibacillus sp. ATY16]
MNIDQIKEALSIPETSLRCERVLDVVQPVLRQLLDSFKTKYANQAPDLIDYYVHTYESTLRTTMHDARNPKYAESKANSDIGKKAFVELIDKRYFQSDYSALMLAFNGLDRTFKIVISSPFHPFWEAVRNLRNTEAFNSILNSLSDEVIIYAIDKEEVSLRKEELVPYISQAVSDKRKPSIYFGTVIDFNELPSAQDLVDLIWKTWNELEPIRLFIRNHAETQALSLSIFEHFNTQEDIALKLHNKEYLVKFDQVNTIKTNHRRQKFNIYNKGQLVTDGMLDQYSRDPHEFIGVFINGKSYLYYNMRNLHGDGKVNWTVLKSFRFRGENQSPSKNKDYGERAVAELVKHGFEMDGTSFKIGTWDNQQQQFIEPITEIKKRLITAAALFADTIKQITLPKDQSDDFTAPENEGQDSEEFQIDEVFQHDFNLSKILSNVHESPFTYSNSIIRDFHLNLVSLEDKHFVILNGISGTGKTRLCLLYANAVYGKTYDALNPYLKVIPVRPDWTDSTSLFGYYSALEKRYVRTPFLNAVLQAIEEGKPMFVVLDEMNLARVEYYLSDYLSAIESRQPIRLHTESQITDVPQELHIPHNLYVIGTINVDETTHSISDKVLDRAFVMTLSDVDLDQFWENVESKYKAVLHEEWGHLEQLHFSLSRYDLHFGYRTMNEMLRKLYANAELDQDIRMDKNDAFDRVIAEKVLPKIRGDERIESLLESLIDWTSSLFGNHSQSYGHLRRMKGELDRYGAAQFWR